MMRIGVVLVAVVAGIGAGALVFKVVGEERIGGEIKAFANRLGLAGAGTGTGALDLVEKIAPGTKDNMQTAVITTIVASLLTATAVAVAVEEIAS